MMFLTLILILGSLFIVYVIYAVIKYIFFPDLEIIGDSMLPTLSQGEIYTSKRIFFKKRYDYKVGKIYVFLSKHEDGESTYAIKRLKQIDPESGNLWFEGDNSVVSYDSRMYGYVSRSCVIAELRQRVR